MINIEEPKWYIITAINGSEDVVYENLEDKIRAYDLGEYVHEIKLLKTREITVEIFDNKNNPPPKLMRNTKSITWETLPGHKYKKTRVREVNLFPGYIYIKMIMTPSVWYTIRNTIGVTGFVGSSGKGASPIPMSDVEVEELFNENNVKDIIINKTEYDDVEVNVDKEAEKKEVKVEFFDLNNLPKKVEDDFYDSTKTVDDIEKSFEAHLGGRSNLQNHEDFFSKAKDDTVENFENSDSENDIFIYDEGMKDEVINIVEDETTIEQESLVAVKEDEDAPQEFQDVFSKENKVFTENSDAGNEETKPIKSAENFEYSVGNTVEITSGGMSGQEGLVIAIHPERDEVEIEVDILGRKTQIMAKTSEIKKPEV